MKLFKFGLRIWIMFTSIMSFLAGWIMLAHAPKPVQQTSSPSIPNITPLPTLAPLPGMNGANDQNNNNLFQSSLFSVQPSLQALPQSPNNFAPAPIFRTGGS